MRSIGKRNIALVKATTRKAMNEGLPALLQLGYSSIEEAVVARLPSSLWDTWEMADQEIRRIITDEIWSR